MGPGFDQSIGLAGIPLRSPVLVAAGCAGSGRELARFTDLRGFGAVVTRSITADPRPGRPAPRIAETPSGLLNAVGLPGPGIEDFVIDELPWLMSATDNVIVSLAADTVAEYGRLASQLRQVTDVAGIEINLSSPVLDAGVLPFSTDASGSAAVVHAVRRNTSLNFPVLAKLSGDVADVVPVARACVEAGADALSLINAVRGLEIDVVAAAPVLGARVGGLSGPAIRPIAMKAVWDTHAALPTVPIVASGGVVDGESALEMIMAGATAVAVGSALISDPKAGERITAELADLVQRSGEQFSDLIGSAHGPGDQNKVRDSGNRDT